MIVYSNFFKFPSQVLLHNVVKIKFGFIFPSSPMVLLCMHVYHGDTSSALQCVGNKRERDSNKKFKYFLNSQNSVTDLNPIENPAATH